MTDVPSSPVLFPGEPDMTQFPGAEDVTKLLQKLLMDTGHITRNGIGKNESLTVDKLLQGLRSVIDMPYNGATENAPLSLPAREDILQQLRQVMGLPEPTYQFEGAQTSQTDPTAKISAQTQVESTNIPTAQQSQSQSQIPEIIPTPVITASIVSTDAPTNDNGKNDTNRKTFTIGIPGVGPQKDYGGNSSNEDFIREVQKKEVKYSVVMIKMKLLMR